jgi:hypothetical protein
MHLHFTMIFPSFHLHTLHFLTTIDFPTPQLSSAHLTSLHFSLLFCLILHFKSSVIICLPQNCQVFKFSTPYCREGACKHTANFLLISGNCFLILAIQSFTNFYIYDLGVLFHLLTLLSILFRVRSEHSRNISEDMHNCASYYMPDTCLQ